MKVDGVLLQFAVRTIASLGHFLRGERGGGGALKYNHY